MATTCHWNGPLSLARTYAAACDDVVPFTVGVEEELLLVDPETLLPVPGIGRALAAVDGDRRYASELRACQLEIITPVCASAPEIAAELAAARRNLLDRLDDGILAVAAAVHPLDVPAAAITDSLRYRRVANDCGPSAVADTANGLHIHVAVGGAERTLAVFNALRSYLPDIAALAANSPIAGGVDTGLASRRLGLLEALPQTGIPPRISSWQALAEYVAWGRTGGLVDDPSFLWWHMRPHPTHGTIEIRIADTQTSVEHAAGIAAFCQMLVADLALRHSAGETLPTHDDFRIRTNAWQAQRHGLDATLLDLDTGEPEAVRTRIAKLLVRLDPVSESIGCADDLDLTWGILWEGGAERQRRIAAESGVEQLVRWLASETELSARRSAPDATADLAVPEATERRREASA